MSTKARRLGGDWVESTDPASGKIYYANLKTKETSWVMPAEVKELLDKKAKAATKQSFVAPQNTAAASPKNSVSVKNQSPANKNNPANDSDDQWLERQDPRSGKTYYYNPVLKQTSWTKPEKSVTAASSDPNYGKGAWVGRVDPRTGRTFYFNTVTKMTSWSNPDEAEETESKKKSIAMPAQQPAAPARSSTASKVSASISQRMSNKRISMQPKAEDQPAYEEAAPAAPTNRTSTRASIRLGAIPNAPKAGSRMSMADIAREKKAAITGDIPQQAEDTPQSLEDRFARLRALRDRAQPNIPVNEETVTEDKKQIDIRDLAEEAKAGVDFDMPFEEYAQTHFATSKKGFFGSKQFNLGDLIQWRPEKIKTSLHNLQDAALVHDSILAFTNIQLYMGDQRSRDPMSNLQKIFKITSGRCPEELRDEVYCQIIKQTTNNPSESSCVRGWELMVIATGCFPPSNKLEKYLISFINRSTRDPPYAGVSRFAEYALVRLTKSLLLGPRTEAPTDVELIAARELKPVTIRVHMLDGSITPMEAESWMTVSELNANMARTLGIKDSSPFGVFEVNDQDEERALEEDDRVLDVIAYWDREKRAAKSKKNAPLFQFVYKVHLFFDIKESDTKAVEVAYYQAVHDVTDSRYPCSEDDCFRLAALQAQQRFGDCDGRDVFGRELQAFLPAKYYHPDIEKDLKAEIMSTYQLLKGYDSHEAMNNYLDYVRSWKIYGSQYFFVEPQNQKAELPPDVVLAVNASGVLVVDPASKEFLAEYPYSEVVTWGHSSITFVLVVGNLMRQNKLYFKTDQGAEINRLVHAYVNRLVEG